MQVMAKHHALRSVLAAVMMALFVGSVFIFVPGVQATTVGISSNGNPGSITISGDDTSMLSPNAPAPVTLTIKAVYADGLPPNPSMWTVLWQNGNLVATGFTPVTFNVSPGVDYTISTADYRDIKFHHWQDTGSSPGPAR